MWFQNCLCLQFVEYWLYFVIFSVTIPEGDILLEYGEHLRILCILNVNHSSAVGKSSSDLVFFHDDRLMPQQLVKVINSTALEIYIEKPAISSSMYYCKLKVEETPAKVTYTAVCLNSVVVDRKYDSEDTKLLGDTNTV